MFKIKLFAVAGILSLAAIVLSNSSAFETKAEDESILQAISNYKNWTKITKEPIAIDAGDIAISG